MYTAKPPLRARIGAGALTALAVLSIGWALKIGLAWTRLVKSEEAPAIVTITLIPPPPKAIVPDRKASRDREGEAAPPNIRSTPVEIIAPPPAILVLPSPITTAPVSDTGPDASTGAAHLPGPGQGAGGIGDGRGSGGAGDGTGGGLRRERPPRRIKGRLSFSDAAKVADSEALIGRAMTTTFFVEPNGQVSGCSASRSTGLSAVDAEICRLIEERFRYEPARDAEGRAVRSRISMDHTWNERF